MRASKHLIVLHSQQFQKRYWVNIVKHNVATFSCVGLLHKNLEPVVNTSLTVKLTCPYSGALINYSEEIFNCLCLTSFFATSQRHVLKLLHRLVANSQKSPLFLHRDWKNAWDFCNYHAASRKDRPFGFKLLLFLSLEALAFY